MVDRAPAHLAERLCVLFACLGWLLPGLYGREPWKADEGYSFGLVLSMLSHGDWLVPTLAGEPFMEKPPLVFWLGATLASVVPDAVPAHVAARGSNLLLALMAFWLAWLAARQALGTAPARLAVLLLAAAPAWLAASKYLIADVGLVPAAGLVCLGLIRLARRQDWAGLLLGAGAAAGLMSKGVLLPGVAGLTCVVLMACAPRYRDRHAFGAWAQALAAFCVLGLAWPLLLWLRSPDLFSTWLIDNNLGRFIGSNGLGPPRRWQTPVSYALFLLPGWPLAIAWAWRARGGLREHPLLGVALFALIFVAVLLASATARPIYALPILLPLSVLGAAALAPRVGSASIGPAGVQAAAASVSADAHGAGDPPAPGRFGRLAMPLAVLLAVSATVAPIVGKAWMWRTRPDAPLAGGPLQPELIVLALALPLAFVLARRGGTRWRPLEIWVGGLALGFVVAAALFLPAADARARYREVFVGATGALPQPRPACIASRGLGETERGMLEYYAGVLTRRLEIDPAAASACGATLEQERVGLVTPGEFGCPGARVAWSGGRPGQDDEVFRVCLPAR